MRALKIVSYNIRHGEDTDFDMGLLAGAIKSVGGEVVGIQEIDMCADRSQNRNQIEELKEALGFEYGYFLRCIDIAGGQYGTAVVSKYPIKDVKTYALTRPNGREQRMLGVYMLDIDGCELTFANTHLDFGSESVIGVQMSELNEYLSSYERLILTGDFNTGNMKLFEKIENVSYVMNENTRLVTFPYGDQTIDNIVYRGNISLGAYGTVKQSYSDHYMLWAELKI